MKKMIVCGGLVMLVACAITTEGTGSSSGGGACPDITGNYSATAERVSGTCDPALDRKGAMGVGVQRTGDGWSIVIPGLEGGCPGTFDETSCTFSAACEVRDKNGVVLGTSSISYTFTATGFAGSNVSGLRPPAVAERCEATYKVTGTKL
jgi:hypothetical protein